MDTTFITGLIGSIVLVAGAAWPMEKVKHPILSIKNWLFLVGGLLMLAYAILNYYLNQAPFFFVIFEIFLAFTAVLMMANTDDRLDTILVTIATIGFVIWSIMLFEDYGTIVFIVGLSTIGLGYYPGNGQHETQPGSVHRQLPDCSIQLYYGNLGLLLVKSLLLSFFAILPVDCHTPSAPRDPQENAQSETLI